MPQNQPCEPQISNADFFKALDIWETKNYVGAYPCHATRICEEIRTVFTSGDSGELQSSEATELRMKALVYIRIQVNNVAAPKVTANVAIIMFCMSSGSTKLETTPSGGCRAGL